MSSDRWIDWKPVSELPYPRRVLVFLPPEGKRDGGNGAAVFEAQCWPDGSFGDPVYGEWDGRGATMYAELPTGPNGEHPNGPKGNDND